MAIEILMPKLNQKMTKGIIKKWHKKVGDVIEKGDLIFSATVDKMTADISSEHNGVLLGIAVREGQTANIDQMVAYIGNAGEKVPEACIPTEDSTPRQVSESAVTVAVIGGGPGGYVAAIAAAQQGARVTLIERDRLGGTCLNVGCIPTKALLHSAALYIHMKGSEKLGVTAEKVSVNWKKVQEYKESVSARLTNGVSGLMELNDIEIIEGNASFIGPKEIAVELPTGDTRTITPDRVIIASGSESVIPPVSGIKENPNCINSTGALSLQKIPDSMVVIGGGVIGVELAWAYSRFGTKVTILEMLPKLMPMMDAELAQIVLERMEETGIQIRLNTKVLSVEPCTSGARVRASLAGGDEVYFDCNKVLVAVGRRPNIAELGLEHAGVAIEKGKIMVDKKMQTNVADVYAIGDCVGQIMLAHTASTMGEVAAHNATGGRRVYRDDVCPSCVYVDPEFASVGVTEEQANAKGISFKVGKFPIAANGKSLIEGCSEGMVKVIAEKMSGKVIGVHILAPRATDLIAEAALAVRMGVSVKQLADTIHAHPTMAESIREAALATDEHAIHIK